MNPTSESRTRSYIRILVLPNCTQMPHAKEANQNSMWTYPLSLGSSQMIYAILHDTVEAYTSHIHL